MYSQRQSLKITPEVKMEAALGRVTAERDELALQLNAAMEMQAELDQRFVGAADRERKLREDIQASRRMLHEERRYMEHLAPPPCTTCCRTLSDRSDTAVLRPLPLNLLLRPPAHQALGGQKFRGRAAGRAAGGDQGDFKQEERRGCPATGKSDHNFRRTNAHGQTQ